MLQMVGLGGLPAPPVLQAAVAEPCRVSATKQCPQHPPALPGVCASAAAAAARHRRGVLRAASPGSFRLSLFHLGSCFEGFFLRCSFMYTCSEQSRVLLKSHSWGTNESSVQQTPPSTALSSWTWQNLMGQVIHPSK